MWPKSYSEREFLRRFCFSCRDYRVLNAGSADVRYPGGDCVNVDIQAKPGVDRVCDIHDLPFEDASFDIGFSVCDSLTPNRYLNAALAEAARIVLYPLRWLTTRRESRTAGAFYLIAKKPE